MNNRFELKSIETAMRTSLCGRHGQIIFIFTISGSQYRKTNKQK